jgi:hypothetical protein
VKRKKAFNLSDSFGREGMRNIGRLILPDKFMYKLAIFRSKTRSATLRSLSNHVCHIPDPRGKAASPKRSSLNVSLPKSCGSSFLSQLLLPTSSKPYYCFSSAPLKQSSEAAAAAAISKDASIFPDLKRKKKYCNLLVEEEEKDNSSTVPIAVAKKETNL